MIKKPSIAAVLLFFILHIPANAQNTAAFPRLTPDPKALEYFRPDGGYSWIELAQISLWASGDNSSANLEKIRQTAETLNKSADFPASGRERAEYILTFLYRNILRSYSIYQTRVDTIFSNGRYNCVSSAVLYMILCESAGIKTSGVVTRDHAFVIVHIDGEDIDVETTNRYGFDPGNRKDFHDQFGNSTGFIYVPARSYRDRQTISKIELVSLILNNRISDLERQNNYAASVPLAIDRAALLFGNSLAANLSGSSEALFEDPRKEVMDRLFNYGAMLLRSNREIDALRWAAVASTAFPDTQRWQDFYAVAVNNQITRYLRAANITEAGNFLESNKQFITADNYAQFDIAIIEAGILRNASQIRSVADGEAVISEITAAVRKAAGKIGENRTAELITYAVQKTAAALCEPPGRNWREAIRYLENAIVRFGSNQEFERALKTYRDNLVIDYHNRFAAEWNRRNYDEAERILNEGLAEFPNERQLLSDMETVNKNRLRQQSVR